MIGQLLYGDKDLKYGGDILTVKGVKIMKILLLN